MSTKKLSRSPRECSISLSSNEYSSLRHYHGGLRTYTTTSDSSAVNLRPDSVAFYQQPFFWFKLSMIVLLAVIFSLAVFYYKDIMDEFEVFIQWIEDHPIKGIIAYVAFCILWLVCFLPETVLTVGAGFVFSHIYGTKGIAIAVTLVFIGSQLGMLQAFLNGRYLMRQCTQRLASKYATLLLMDQIVEQHGVKVTLLLRLTPLTPYNVMNYMMGITSISALDFVLGNFGILPDCILMAFVGSFLSSITQIGNASDGLSRAQKRSMLIYTISGTLVAILLFVWVTILAKREFYKMSVELRLGRNSRSRKVYDEPVTTKNKGNGTINGKEDDNIGSLGMIGNDQDESPQSQSNTKINIDTPTQRRTPELADQSLFQPIASITEFIPMTQSRSSEHSRDGLESTATPSVCSLERHRSRPNAEIAMTIKVPSHDNVFES